MSTIFSVVSAAGAVGLVTSSVLVSAVSSSVSCLDLILEDKLLQDGAELRSVHGDTFHYRITRSLGRGGFGATYEAEDLLMDRTVCIKQLFVSFEM